MKKILIGSSMLVVFFAACKKSDDSSSSSSKIVGRWTKTYDAVDVNNNGSVDASEKVAIPAGDYDYATYKSDGTVSDSSKTSGVAFNLAGTYTVTGDYLNITVTGLGSFSGKITSVDDHNLVLQDTSAHPAEWTIYTK